MKPKRTAQKKMPGTLFNPHCPLSAATLLCDPVASYEPGTRTQHPQGPLTPTLNCGYVLLDFCCWPLHLSSLGQMVTYFYFHL